MWKKYLLVKKPRKWTLSFFVGDLHHQILPRACMFKFDEWKVLWRKLSTGTFIRLNFMSQIDDQAKCAVWSGKIFKVVKYIPLVALVALWQNPKFKNCLKFVKVGVNRLCRLNCGRMSIIVQACPDGLKHIAIIHHITTSWGKKADLATLPRSFFMRQAMPCAGKRAPPCVCAIYAST